MSIKKNVKEASKFICVRNNCAWESDFDENNIDNGKWVLLSAEMTNEEIINADILIKVYKYHDGEENKLRYVWQSGEDIAVFTEMFNHPWERDIKFDRLATILKAR